MAAINRFVNISAAALAWVMLTTSPGFVPSARGENYAVYQGHLHSFDKVDVFSGVFALNTDVSLESSIYFKYVTDIISITTQKVTTVSSDTGTSSPSTSPDTKPKPSPSPSPSPSPAPAPAPTPAPDVFISPSAMVLSPTEASIQAAAETRQVESVTSVEERREVTFGYTHNLRDAFELQTSIYYSTEDDYTSLSPSLTIKKELNNKNTTSALGYSHGFDEVEGPLLQGGKDRDSDFIYLGVTQVGYTHSEVSGYLGDGANQFVLDSGVVSSEILPESRSKDSIMAGVNYFFKESIPSLGSSAVHLTTRYYNDDWGINSLTGEVEYLQYITPSSLISFNYRAYSQSAASFSKDVYSAADPYRSTASNLKEFDSSLYGIKLTWTFESLLPAIMNEYHLSLKLQRYSENYADRSVDANVFMLGLKFDF